MLLNRGNDTYQYTLQNAYGPIESHTFAPVDDSAFDAIPAPPAHPRPDCCRCRSTLVHVLAVTARVRPRRRRAVVVRVRIRLAVTPSPPPSSSEVRPKPMGRGGSSGRLPVRRAQRARWPARVPISLRSCRSAPLAGYSSNAKLALTLAHGICRGLLRSVFMHVGRVPVHGVPHTGAASRHFGSSANCANLPMRWTTWC